MWLVTCDQVPCACLVTPSWLTLPHIALLQKSFLPPKCSISCFLSKPKAIKFIITTFLQTKYSLYSSLCVSLCLALFLGVYLCLSPLFVSLCVSLCLFVCACIHLSLNYQQNFEVSQLPLRMQTCQNQVATSLKEPQLNFFT